MTHQAIMFFSPILTPAIFVFLAGLLGVTLWLLEDDE